MKNSIYVISKNIEYVLFSKQTLHGRPMQVLSNNDYIPHHVRLRENLQ